jgi:Zn-dependent protease with chaperone function
MERLAVMAHELVHVKKKHNKKIFCSIIFIVCSNLILIGFIKNNLLLIPFIYTVIGFFIIPPIQRKNEKEADIIGATLTNPDSLLEAIKKPYNLNLISKNSNWWGSSHPRLETRIKYLSALMYD